MNPAGSTLSPRPRTSDLRVGLAAVALVALAVAALTRLPVALVALAGAALLVLAARVPPGRVLHRLAHVEGVLLVLLAVLPFTTPGHPLFHLGPLAASAEGLARALLIAAKVNTVALVLLVLLDGAAPERLGRALLGLGAPVRFVRLMALILRHSHTARDSLRRQSEAMRARGFRPASTLHAWRSYGHLFGGALLRAFARAERVEEAMRLRGGHHIPLPLPPLSARAKARIVLAALAAAALLALDRLA